MSAPIIIAVPVSGRIFAYGELYPVIHDDDADGVLVVDASRDFDYPRNNAEYVRGLGFLFNEARLVSSGVA